jgi:hypothetical protein
MHIPDIESLPDVIRRLALLDFISNLSMAACQKRRRENTTDAVAYLIAPFDCEQENTTVYCTLEVAKTTVRA